MEEITLVERIQDELDAAVGDSSSCKRLAEYVATDIAYAAGQGRYAVKIGGYRQFQPINAALAAFDLARSSGSAAEGARWLIKVLRASSARVRLILEVGGVEVTGPDVILRGMTLTRGSRLPHTETSVRMFASVAAESLHETGISYIYQDIERTDLWTTERPRRDTRPDPFSSLRVFAARLAIIREASPAVLRVWSEHLDPDLDRVFGMKGWGQPGQDAAAPWYPEEIRPDDVPLLERLYGLTGRHQKVIDIALERINLGRRRVSPGNTAIDAAIALEALLGDPSSTSDMTYKLRLRAALFLADTLEGRRTLSKEVRDLYGLRSKVAHGGEATNGATHAVAARGVEIVRELLHKLVEQPGGLPDWPDWELAGGDPAGLMPSSTETQDVN